jgi:hypothetical protein
LKFRSRPRRCASAPVRPPSLPLPKASREKVDAGFS